MKAITFGGSCNTAVACTDIASDKQCVEHLAVSFDGQQLSRQDVVYKVFHSVLNALKLKNVDQGSEEWSKYPTSFKELTQKFSCPVSSWQLSTRKETDSPSSTDSQFNPWQNLS